jgi:hypothetical protein
MKIHPGFHYFAPCLMLFLLDCLVKYFQQKFDDNLDSATVEMKVMAEYMSGLMFTLRSLFVLLWSNFIVERS